MTSFNIGDLVTALYDFTKQQQEDLNVWSGDTLAVVNNQVGEGWLILRNIYSNEQGMVPESYVQFKQAAQAPSRPTPATPAAPTAPQVAAKPASLSVSSPEQPRSGSTEDDYDQYDSDDFDSDDYESAPKGMPMPNRPAGGKAKPSRSLFSRLTSLTGAAVNEYVAGVGLPNEKPKRFLEITFYDGRPLWSQAEIFNINFGQRQDGSKIGGFKKFQVYSVTPTSTNKSVLRRYKHFDWLIDRLHELYPEVAVPGLPDAKVTGHDDAFIRDREQKLVEWSNRMASHPIISQSDVFQHFVTVSEKNEKVWKNGKRKAEKDPFKGMNSYLAVDGDPTNFNYINSKRVLPALEAYTKYSNEVDKHSKLCMNAAKGITTIYIGSLKDNYRSLGKSVATLGTQFKRGLSGNYTDLIYFPEMTALGSAFESIGACYQKVSEMYHEQTEKDFEVLENNLWVHTGCIEHIPTMLKMNQQAADTCSRQGTNEQEAVERLTKVQAATLAEINHLQVNTPSQYKNMMATTLREQINFYKSLIAVLEPQLQVLEGVQV